MAEAPPPEKLVYIADKAIPALEHPRFIVNVNGKYYVTFGAWEYDPHPEGVKLTDEQHEDIRRIADAFARGGPSYQCVIAPEAVAFGGGHTAPAPKPGPVPGPQG